MKHLFVRKNFTQYIFEYLDIASYADDTTTQLKKTMSLLLIHKKCDHCHFSHG